MIELLDARGTCYRFLNTDDGEIETVDTGLGEDEMEKIPCPSEVYQAELNYMESPELYHQNEMPSQDQEDDLGEITKMNNTNDYYYVRFPNISPNTQFLFHAKSTSTMVKYLPRRMREDYNITISSSEYFTVRYKSIYVFKGTTDLVAARNEIKDLKAQLEAANYAANKTQNELSAAEDELNELRERTA